MHDFARLRGRSRQREHLLGDGGCGEHSMPVLAAGAAGNDEQRAGIAAAECFGQQLDRGGIDGRRIDGREQETLGVRWHFRERSLERTQLAAFRRGIDDHGGGRRSCRTDRRGVIAENHDHR